jgi:RNA polymerase sigma factor (sigma-70 family)
MMQGGREVIDSLDGWLITLTSHVLVDELRTHQALKRGGRQQPQLPVRQASYLNLFNRMASARNTPSSEVAVGEAVRLVQSALDCLPAELARVVRLRHLEGLTYEQIAAEIERSVPAVRGLLTRGLAKLRLELRSAGRFFSDASTLAANPTINE